MDNNEGWEQYRLLVIRELERLSKTVEGLNDTVIELKELFTANVTANVKSAADMETKVNTMWKAIGALGVLAVGAIIAKFVGK